MRHRATQTNEAARCAGIYPLLARLPQPLALIEVGAAAGLCLLPDHYGYDYLPDPHRPTRPRAHGDRSSPVRLRCTTHGPHPTHHHTPRVVWRAGIDLAPLDVTAPDDLHWLEALIWPGPNHDARLRRLRAATTIARTHPPHLTRGDLIDHLPALAAAAPPEATVVVYHTAVLAYLSPTQRTRFAATVRALPAHWICQEPPALIPGLSPPAPPPGHAAMFTLAHNGHPLAHTAPHGDRIHWFSAAATP